MRGVRGGLAVACVLAGAVLAAASGSSTASVATMVRSAFPTMKALGFSYDLDAQTWRYAPPGGGTSLSGTAASDKLNRIINTHLASMDFPNLNGNGIVETYGGEYIKFENNKVYSTGNQEAGIKLNIDSSRTTENGTVYYVNGLLSEPSLAVGKHLETLANQPNSPFLKFFNYLKNSNIYNTSTGEILGITAGAFYTLLVPTNTAIDNAVALGYLPASNAPSDAASKNLVANFIRYHIIQKATIVTDGLKDGGYTTLLQKANGDPTIVTVMNTQPNNMSVKDMLGNTANVVNGSSNNLSNRTVIHLLDSFLRYDTSQE